MEYYNETVRVAWTGAAGGTSAIKGYRISSRTSTNNSSWGAWIVLATVDNTATSGFYDPTVNNTPGLYTQFRVETIDVLGTMSTERLTNSILCNVSQAGAPTACSLNATLAEGDVTLAWSGSLAGAGNAIISYEIQYSDSTNNTTWGRGWHQRLCYHRPHPAASPSARRKHAALTVVIVFVHAAPLVQLTIQTGQ
ncbi:hypothetical protein FACS18948_4200 [Clostridia bacterium]|nr:hypothetical protein FACS18948_4200 [Clostridia bacterium]